MPGLWNRLSEDEQQDIFDFVEENFPEMSDRLESQWEEGEVPTWFRRQVPGFIELMDMMDRHPEKARLMIQERKLEMKMHFLARRFAARGGDAMRQRAEKEMTRLCSEWFDVRLQLRAQMILELENRLGRLRKKHEMNTEQRDEMIAREVQRRLGGEADDMHAAPDRRPHMRRGRRP
jgi:hypothetical protein